MKNEFSLYIHIPFCLSKCDYCDFYSEVYSPDLPAAQRKITEYLYALINDINYQIEKFNVNKIVTAYIGGGTPSVLANNINVLLDALKKIPVFTPQEFTIEANPESLTQDFLLSCKEGGVTRLSLGVQTLCEQSRCAINRRGDLALLEKALCLAKKYYPCDLSVDIITGLPFQTKDIVINDIKKILEYNPAHVSLYSLTVEKETALYRNIISGALCLPDNDESDELWLVCRDELLKNGFLHYEVSNFAKEDKMCLHNIRYWRMKNWLGAGPSSSGTIIDSDKFTAMRYTKINNTDKYIQENETKPALCEITEKINKKNLIKEIILMGYRYYKGPDPKWKIEKYIPDTLNKNKYNNIMIFLNSFLKNAFDEINLLDY